MRESGLLRRRIVRAHLLVAAIVCSCFVAITAFSVDWIEARLIDDRLVAAADQSIRNHRQGLTSDVPGDPVVWPDARIPPNLRALADGIHEIHLGDRALHVLLRTQDGDRYAVVHDDTDYEHVASDLLYVLAIACAAGLAIAWGVGRLTVNRVIAPLVALSDAVRDRRRPSDADALAAPDEIGVLARALAERTDELERYLLREQLFTGDVSHELRTPLTVILGASEILEGSLRDRPDLLAAANRIHRTAADTAERIGALLLLSRAPQAIDAPAIDLVTVVAHEVDRCRPLLHGKPVMLRTEVMGPARVHGRPELAGMAIGNLVRNACQFTESGEVVVRVASDRIEIEDTGPGIPAGIRDRVFERFVRGPSSGVEGSGLGLAIVRRVAAHLGWTVTLEDVPSGGSRFVLTFPAASSRDPHAELTSP